MVNTPCQGLDRAAGLLCALVVDHLASDSVLLVGDAEGGVMGLEELFQWAGAGDDGHVLPAECDVLDTELTSAAAFFVRCIGVLPDPEQIVESDDDQVTDGLDFGAGGDSPLL